MGTNSLTTVADGDLILAAHHNQLLQALRQDLVPRNNSDIPEDVFGQLGTSALRWLRAYVDTYHIGTAANNLTINEAVVGEIHINTPNESVRIRSGVIEFWVGGAKMFSVGNSGIDWSTQAANSIPISKVNGFIFDSHTTQQLTSAGGPNSWTAPWSCLVWVKPADFDSVGDAVYVEYLTAPLTPGQFGLIQEGSSPRGSVGGAYLDAGDKISRVNTSGTVLLHIFRI